MPVLRIYLNTYGNVRIISKQNPEKSFMVNSTEGVDKFKVKIPGSNQFLLVGRDRNGNGHGVIIYTRREDISFSFEIGYPNWVMANVQYQKSAENERELFGNYQLHINNNWRITTGPTPYVLNSEID